MRIVVLFAALLFVPNTQAAFYSLNFDTDLSGNAISAGTLVRDAYKIPGVTFSSNFEIYRGYTIPSLPNEAAPSNFPNQAPVEIDFATAYNYISAINVTFSRFTLTAYDSNGNLLGSSSVTDYGQVASLQVAGISRVLFTPDIDPTSLIAQFGIDNLQFSDIGANPNAVPEPSSLVLVSCGLGLMYFQKSGRRLT